MAGITIRELAAKVGLQVSPSGFKQADELLSKVKKTLGEVTTLAGAVGLALVGLSKGAKAAAESFTEMGDQAIGLSRLSTITDVGTVALQGLTHAASAAGISSDGLKGALTGLMSKMYATTIGSVDAVMAFGRLGVSIREAGGKFKPVNVVLEQALEKISKIKDPIMRMGKAAAVGLAEFLPALEDGFAGFQKLQQKVKDFHADLTGDDIQNIKEYRKVMADLGLFFQGMRNDTLGPFYDLFSKVGKKISEFIQADKGKALNSLRAGFGQFQTLEPVLTKIAQWAVKLIPVIGFIGHAFAGIARVILFCVEVIGEFLEWMYKVPAVGNILTTIGIAVFASWFPMLALFAAIFLIAEDFIMFFKGGKSFIGGAVLGFIEWLEVVERGGGVFSGLAKAILDAFSYISSGQLKKDWDETVNAIRMFWEGLFKWLDDKMGGFGRSVRKIVRNIDPSGFILKVDEKQKQEDENFEVGEGFADLARKQRKRPVNTRNGIPVTRDDLPAYSGPGSGKAPIDLKQTVNINVNGAGDPNAVGAEVIRQQKDVMEPDALVHLNPGSPR